MIYGFIIDNSFINPEWDVRDIEENAPTGYLTMESYSYFRIPNAIKDPRSERMHLFNEPLSSKMKILMDEHEKNISATHLHTLENCDPSVKVGLFNIIEYCFFRLTNETVENIDHELVNDNEQFICYVPDSLSVSMTTHEAMVYDNADVECNIMEWVSFSADINGTVMDFKFWIDTEHFRQDYPITFIDLIKFPISQEQIISKENMDNTYDDILNNILSSVSDINKNMAEDNHSGYTVYVTKHVNSEGAVYELPFQIFYKGKEPTNLQIREAIKLELNYVLASEDTWKERLPDLFIRARFYIVPTWDHVTEEPNRETYPSVISYNKMFETVRDVMVDFDEHYIQNQSEVVMSAYLESPVMTIPDTANLENTSIYEEHPTYQYYASSSSSFLFQSVLTREFNVKLNRALSVAKGEATITDFKFEEINGRAFVVFIVDSIEYFVITKGSYNLIMGAD